VDNLRRLYDCFYRLIDPREGITNDWVLADRHIAGLHTLFPKAFFSNIDDPSLNMVLKHEGGAAKAPLSLALSLGTVMRISVIEIDGSPDCAVVIGLQAPIADMFQVSAGSKCECNFTGRFLSLVVQAGTLARLRIVGLPIPQEKITATIDLKRLPDPKKIPCRRVPVAAKRQVFLDVGKERPIQGIVFRDCIGVRSVLLAFFAITWVNPQEKPVAVEYGFLPDCQESEFVMRFRSPVTAKMVQIQFYDVLQRYLDPKIELF
jgi:hypothetical protein